MQFKLDNVTEMIFLTIDESYDTKNGVNQNYRGNFEIQRINF